MAKHRYGRGKFEAHANYIGYMEEIVQHPNYRGMPGAVTDDGHIRWQVSSGRTTSFYEYYLARFKWWEEKADYLGLPGQGNEAERFSIAARRVHPTGYRPCRICGEFKNVGYFYLNANFAKKLQKEIDQHGFFKGQEIPEAVSLLRGALDEPELLRFLHKYFPERMDGFEGFGATQEAFAATNHLKSTRLSPGFMCNPPDRLDGFHDYCIDCRASNDPGRSEENLRSYAHDRRAFEWWAEGEWSLADALFNAAGPGSCAICGAEVDKVSPDHIGPLACGFKHMPFFQPTCSPCNSAKNRRMRLEDIRKLVDYEDRSGSSTASWQVRGLWDQYKNRVKSDDDARELSAQMRAFQDYYLRCLHSLLRAGHARFLRTLIHPEYAFFSYSFRDLNPATFEFSGYSKETNVTALRGSLAQRCVRIAFVEVENYARKQLGERKIRTLFSDLFQESIHRIVERASSNETTPVDEEWQRVVTAEVNNELKERDIGVLLEKYEDSIQEGDGELREFMEFEFAAICDAAEISLGGD